SQAALSHAVVIAIGEANRIDGSWRLEYCTRYVTFESCVMCAGVIVQSRMRRVVFGTFDPKAGCAGTLMNLLTEERFNHQVDVTSGILQDECASLLTNFFRQLRKNKKKS